MKYLMLSIFIATTAQAGNFSLVSCNVSYLNGQQTWVGTYRDWSGYMTTQIFPASQYTYCPVSI